MHRYSHNIYISQAQTQTHANKARQRHKEKHRDAQARKIMLTQCQSPALMIHNVSRYLCRLNQLQATSHNISCFRSCYYGNWTAAVHITQIWYKSLPSCPKYAKNHPAVPDTIGPICTEKNSRNDREKGTTWLHARALLRQKSPHTSLS